MVGYSMIATGWRGTGSQTEVLVSSSRESCEGGFSAKDPNTVEMSVEEYVLCYVL